MSTAVASSASWVQVVVFAVLTTACSPTSTQPTRVDPRVARYLRNAEDLAKRNRLSEAIVEARKATDTAPDHAPAQLELGRLLRRAGVAASAGKDDTLGLYRDARIALERAAELEPALEGPRIELAQLLMDSDRASEAIAVLEPFAVEGTPEARFHLASILAGMGRHDRAIELYRSGLAERPDDVAARIVYGLSLVQTNSLPAARAEFAKAVELNPTSAEAFLQLGMVLAKLGESQLSIVALARNTELNSVSEEGHYALAMAMRKAGMEQIAGTPQHRFDQLKQDLARTNQLADALAADPEQPELRSELADTYLRRGKIVRARAAAELTLLALPRDVRAHRVLAEIDRRTGLPAQALIHIERALDAAPDDPLSLEARARIHIDSRRLDSARADLEGALATGYRSGPAIELLARVWLDSGDPARALEIAELALGEQLHHPALYLVVAEAAIRLDRPGRATQLLNAYLKRRPADPRALRLIIGLARRAQDTATIDRLQRRLEFVLEGKVPPADP